MPKIYYIKIFQNVTHVIQKILEETHHGFQKTKFLYGIFFTLRESP